MPRKDDPAAVASATNRKAVNSIANALRIDPIHTKYPSEDLDAHVELIDKLSKERALGWYRRGLKRGFISACDAVLDGDLELKDGILYSPEEIVISVRIKFKGEKRHHDEEFQFNSQDLGFK